MQLWNEGGVDAFATLWAPDIVFYELPNLPDTDVFRGAEALAVHSRELIATMGHFKFEVLSLEASGPWVFAEMRLHSTGPRSGVIGDGPHFHLLRYEDGLIAELHSYSDQAEARAAFDRVSPASAPPG